MLKLKLILKSKHVILFSFYLILISQLQACKSSEKKEQITVYKSETCNCCSKWITHLEKNGFKVKTINSKNMQKIKKNLKVDLKLASCHTARIDDYIIEGHIPAEVIKKLLNTKPNIKGIAVPGMPIGSPGMEGPRPQKYHVYSFDDNGSKKVFATITPNKFN